MQLPGIFILGSRTGRILTQAGLKKLRKSIVGGGGFKPIHRDKKKEGIGGALDDRIGFMVRVLLPEDHEEETTEERLGMVDGDHRKLLWLEK